MPTIIDRDGALRTLRELEIRLGDCTFAPRGTLFSIPAEEGEQIRRALETIRILAAEQLLTDERIREKVREALFHQADAMMDSIVDIVFETIDEAVDG